MECGSIAPQILLSDIVWRYVQYLACIVIFIYKSIIYIKWKVECVLLTNTLFFIYNYILEGSL
jgi:hypothetical protein